MASGPRIGYVGESGVELFAVAVDLLRWPPAAVAGAEAPRLAAETGARPLDLDALVATEAMDVAIVGSAQERRADDAIALVERGVHVLVVPGLGGDDPRAAADRLIAADQRSPAVIAAATPLVFAPVIESWRSRIAATGTTDHLSGRTNHAALTTELITIVASAATAAGWGPPTSARHGVSAIELSFDAAASTARLAVAHEHTDQPVLAAQAAGPSDALVVDLFPTPSLEHNGEPVAVGSSTEHPGERFGAAPLLRRFVADIGARRNPTYGAQWIRRLQLLLADG